MQQPAEKPPPLCSVKCYLAAVCAGVGRPLFWKHVTTGIRGQRYKTILPTGLHQGPLIWFATGNSLTHLLIVVSLRQHQIHVGYSLCISAATTVAQCGITDSLIKTLGQWQSSAYTVHIWTPRETLCAVAWSLIPPALGLRLYHFVLTYRPIHWYLVVSVTTCMCCIPWIWCYWICIEGCFLHCQLRYIRAVNQCGWGLLSWGCGAKVPKLLM